MIKELDAYFQGQGRMEMRDLSALLREPPDDGEVICYGAGRNASKMAAFLGAAGIRIVCFCDKNTSLHGTDCVGVPVISPEALFRDHPRKSIVLTSERYADEMMQGLREAGIDEKDIFYPYVSGLSKGRHYFEKDIVKPVEDEVFIDAGCYNGDTLVDFTEFYTKRYKKIYAFEPDEENYREAQRMIARRGIGNVELIPKGTWNEEGTLCFDAINTVGSKISDEGKSEIRVTTIDRAVGPERVTYIKMDVEGAELNTLKGARETIVRDRPRLAVSLYHKAEDIIVLPSYILSIAKDYKLYLRHYFNDWSETLLYAVE